MSLEEFEDAPDPKTKRYLMMKSIMDFGMGFLYLGVGVIIFFAKQFHIYNNFTDSIAAKFLAGLVVIYGVFRIYRGIKKDYFLD